MSEKYNGWTNRETWLVNLWFNPETKSDLEYYKDYIEEEFSKLSGFFSDFVDTSVINWRELEEALDEEEDEEE